MGPYEVRDKHQSSEAQLDLFHHIYVSRSRFEGDDQVLCFAVADIFCQGPYAFISGTREPTMRLKQARVCFASLQRNNYQSGLHNVSFQYPQIYFKRWQRRCCTSTDGLWCCESQRGELARSNGGRMMQKRSHAVLSRRWLSTTCGYSVSLMPRNFCIKWRAPLDSNKRLICRNTSGSSNCLWWKGHLERGGVAGVEERG